MSNSKTRALAFLFVYWLGFNFLVLHTPFTVFNSPATGGINQVQYLVSNKESPSDLTNKGWQNITLPDNWYENNQRSEQVWYRTNIDIVPVHDDVWAIYLPLVAHNAAVYINGIWVGQGGKFEKPVSRNHNIPLFFSFSSKLLQTGKNQIDIRVKAAYSEQGFLDEIYLAPEPQLKRYYEWKKYIRVELVRWLTVAMYILSFIILSFWLARSQDVVYGLFALELFIWATHNLNLFIVDIPVSARLWEAMTLSTIGWTVTVMIFFNHRFVGMRSKKVEKILLSFSVLGIGIFFLPDISSVLHIGYKIWDTFIVLFGVYAIVHLLKVYWYKENPDVFLMLLAGIPILVSGLHDVLMFNHLVDRRDGWTMHYSVIPSVLLFSWFLVRRFVTSVSEAENLAKTLEQRVDKKQQELKQQYEKLKLMEKESVLAEERERIMRDMHDGIGGQLVSVITLLQEQSGDVFKRVREKVQLSLTDLRFVIDSLDPLLSDLPTLLGMMRMRIEEQLNDANIKLEWAVTELPEIKSISPRNSLHIMRIVQEAVTNSIKHSSTHKMKVATGVFENKIFIDVVDYGDGFNLLAEKKEQGRGVKNMQYRAEQLNATLLIEQVSNGSRVRLLLPIKA